MTQILGWSTHPDFDREIRLQAIEKLGWVGSPDAEVILRQTLDDRFAGEREAARLAHQRLTNRGVGRNAVPDSARALSPAPVVAAFARSPRSWTPELRGRSEDPPAPGSFRRVRPA